MLNRFLKVAMFFLGAILFTQDFCLASASVEVGVLGERSTHKRAGEIVRKNSGSSTDSLSDGNSDGRPSFELEKDVDDAHGNVSYINPLIGRRVLAELLDAVPYNTCPEFAYNHPLVQGALVFDAESGATPLIKARAFYLLHVVYDNMQLHTANETEDGELRRLSQNALSRSKYLLPDVSEEVFSAYVEEWKRDFVFITRNVEGHRLALLANIENNYFYDKKEQWSRYKEIYDQLDKKYIYESILLARAALREDLSVKTAPKIFLRHANTQYYAEGYIKMAEYLRILANASVEKRNNYIMLAKDLYKKALLEFDDIRAYEYLSGMEDVMDEDVIKKWQELKPMYSDLKKRLLTLFLRDSS